EEVASALESLGFKKRQAEEAATKALQEEGVKTIPAAIKKALSYLNK
ncbi:MAG TPA: Holliday junction branch migration protein RuvA, partial [Balneola sp.]|nr:Holliday junction branch migration protein RuvA [Balneola sp.]